MTKHHFDARQIQTMYLPFVLRGQKLCLIFVPAIFFSVVFDWYKHEAVNDLIGISAEFLPSDIFLVLKLKYWEG